jgi:hypothetical protein
MIPDASAGERQSPPHGFPVAIGGLGGSGTRAVARLVQYLGYYLGCDLNDAMDNLWFTLLFKRRSALLESRQSFERLAHIFFNAMQGDVDSVAKHAASVRGLAKRDRIQHSSAWLSERVSSILSSDIACQTTPSWGWKEPNTHIFADRLLSLKDDLRYVHVVRDPGYMSSSRNQNQLVNWGPVFFDRDISVSPQIAVSYARLVHERVKRLRNEWPDRVMIVRYEDVIGSPVNSMDAIARFLGTAAVGAVQDEFSAYIASRPDKPSPAITDPSVIFDKEDTAYLSGYWHLPA